MGKKVTHHNAIITLKSKQLTWRSWFRSDVICEPRLHDNMYQPISASAAYMYRWTGPTLVQLMACRLFGAKRLPELLNYCQLDLWEQNSVKFESKYKTFHSWKCVRNCRLRNGGHCAQGEISLKKANRRAMHHNNALCKYLWSLKWTKYMLK